MGGWKMLLNNMKCIDAGTVNCPCYLAEYGKCLVCSRLGGSGACGTVCSGGSGLRDAGCGCDGNAGTPAACNCRWQGVCIYNEYLQNGYGAVPPGKGYESEEEQKSGAAGEQRHSMCCKIRKIIWYEENLAVMQVEVPAGIAEKASLPGSYVFMKRPADEPFFYTPLSIMYADYEGCLLHIAVQINGAKTKALLGNYADSCGSEIAVASPIADASIHACEKGSPIADESVAPEGYVELRGIYRNGLLGVYKLMQIGAAGANGAVSDSTEVAGKPAPGSLKVLCLTKGLGLAPVANYIRWADGNHHIDVITDLDKINRRFADDLLAAAGVGEAGQMPAYAHVSDGERLAEPDIGTGQSAVNSVKFRKLPLDFSWAEQEKYDVIIISASDFYQQNIYVPEAKKVLSNNHTMCCGEGICGACICMDADGTAHRMCKECEVR